MKWLLAFLISVLTISSALAENAYVTQVRRPLFVQTQQITVANTLTETTLLGTGIGTVTLPPNYLVQGKVLRIWMWGIHSAVSNPLIQIRVYAGSTLIGDTGLQASHASTNEQWDTKVDITCLTTGTTGTVMPGGFYEEDTPTASPFGMPVTAPITLNTTIAQTLNITVTWGTASLSDTITAQQILIGYED